MSETTRHLAVIISEMEASSVDLLAYRSAALARALAKAWVRETVACLEEDAPALLDSQQNELEINHEGHAKCDV
jgi:hypothetical protein